MNPEEIIAAALKHAASLKLERESRTSGMHADDSRISCEIAGYQFALGKLQRASFAAVDQHHAAVRRHFEQIAKAKEAYSLLQTEMEICNHQKLP